MMEDGFKINCPHCKTNIAMWVRILPRCKVYDTLLDNKGKLKEEAYNVIRAKLAWAETTNQVICPKCGKTISAIIDLFLEVRSPTLEFTPIKKKSRLPWKK